MMENIVKNYRDEAENYRDEDETNKSKTETVSLERPKQMCVKSPSSVP